MGHVMKFYGGRVGTASHVVNCGCRLRPIYTHRNAVLYSPAAKWGVKSTYLDVLARPEISVFCGLETRQFISQPYSLPAELPCLIS